MALWYKQSTINGGQCDQEGLQIEIYTGNPPWKPFAGLLIEAHSRGYSGTQKEHEVDWTGSVDQNAVGSARHLLDRSVRSPSRSDYTMCGECHISPQPPQAVH